MNDVIYRDNLYILEIEADTPRERGQIHGEALRRIGEQKTLKDVTNLLNDVEHSFGMSYLVGDKKQVQSFEVSQNTVKRYEGKYEGRCICHTNHPLIHQNLTDVFKDKMDSASLDENALMSYSRLKTVTDKIDSAGEMPSISQLKEIYRTKPVCVEEDIAETCASVIFKIGENPVLHIAPGIPDKTDY